MTQFRSYIFSATLGLLAVGAIWQIASYVQRESIDLPAPPAAPRIIIHDLPSNMWLESAPATSESFVRRPALDSNIPSSNSVAQILLDDINGRWSGGDIVAIFDARRRLGYVGAPIREVLKPLIVRDVSGRSGVIDVGDQRFVFLRRPNGLAISGGSIRLPIELQHE